MGEEREGGSVVSTILGNSNEITFDLSAVVFRFIYLE